MKWLIVPTASLLALTACGETAEETVAVPAESASSGGVQVAEVSAPAQSIDFGDDASEWANDDECDDMRFTGIGMTTTALLDEDIMHDATDCRTAFEAGTLELSGLFPEEAAPAATGKDAPAEDAAPSEELAPAAK